ncbi:uncharacterized protein LOC128856756 [Anastrepha ludens]|uniref:uncharacterized protein LOC128856756 n=1 Tax=Anastrepha ludens TaxID=28586 RepID=UPI0023B095B5|nr:uncharacterized protein LOC128856756 [Anastrepha ludens]
MSKFNKMFNSETITGRANVAKATYVSFAVLYIIHRLRKRSKAAAKCPECTGDSNKAASVDQFGKRVAEGTCDAETWKRVSGGNEPPPTAEDAVDTKVGSVNPVEVATARNDSSKEGEEWLDIKTLNTESKNTKKKLCENETSIVNEVWGCDF